MSYFTYRINRASPRGTAWEQNDARYQYKLEAVLALIRKLDQDYPGQWKLNIGSQFVLNDSLPGSAVLASIDEHQTEREELTEEIRELEARLLNRRAELMELPDDKA